MGERNDDWEELKTKILNHPKIKDVILRHNLNEENIIDAFPIIIDIYNEIGLELKYHTDLYRASSGSIQRTQVISEYGKKFLFLNNIISNKIFPLDFEQEKKFLVTEERTNALNHYFLKLKNNQSLNKNHLFIYGKDNKGKTFFIKRIISNLAKSNFKIAYMDVPEMVQTIRQSFSEKRNINKIIEIFMYADVLFLDNFGNETIKIWFRDDFLFHIINYRINKKMPIVFVTQFNFQEIKKLEIPYDAIKIKRILNSIEKDTIQIVFDSNIII